VPGAGGSVGRRVRVAWRTSLSGQEVQPVVEPVDQIGDAESAQLPRGQLDRERQTVEAAAQLGHERAHRIGQRETGPHPLGPVDEELDGGGPAAIRATGLRPRARVDGRNGQRVERQYLLVVDAEPAPAGREDGDARGAPRDQPDETGDVRQQVLAVVDHEEHSTRAQLLRDRMLEPGVRPRTHAQQRGQRRGDRVAPAQGSKLEHHHVRTCGLAPASGERLGREPGLPDATWSGDGDQAALTQDRGETHQVLRPADQRGGVVRTAPGRELGRPGEGGRGERRGRRRGQRGILVQDLLLEGLELGRRIEPDLVAEAGAIAAQGLQRVGRASGAVEGQRQQPVRPLAQRPAGGFLFQLGKSRRVVACPQPGGAQLVAHRRLELVEPGPGRRQSGHLPARQPGQVLQRRAAPVVQRIQQQGHGGGRCRRPRLRDEGLDPRAVDLAGLGAEVVAAGTAPQPVAQRRTADPDELAAEPGHLALQAVPGARWWVVAPQGLGQYVLRYGGAARQQQQGQHGAAPGSAESGGPAGHRDVDRPQQAEGDGRRGVGNGVGSGVGSVVPRGHGRASRSGRGRLLPYA